MADTRLQELAKTDRNPAQESEYKALLERSGLPYYAGGNGVRTEDMPIGLGGRGISSGATNATSVLDNAQKFQDFYKKQNEPVIAATEATKAPLEQRYKDLLASIKTNQQTAENRQTVTTQNELGRRGIFTDSGVGAQEMTNALNPITSEYTQRAQDTSNMQNIDIANINKAIAALQAGNPEAAVSGALGQSQMNQSANQFQQQLAATQRQNDIQNALAQSEASKPNTAIVESNGRKLLINQLTGATIQDLGPVNTGSSGTDITSLIQATGNVTGGGFTPLPTPSMPTQSTVKPANSYDAYNQLQNMLGWNLMRGQ